MAKSKIKPVDGLGPYEVKKIRAALRQLWHRSLARKLVVKRCLDKDGWSYCEQCFSRTPKLAVDHITPCGEVDGGYIGRLFCSSQFLRGLCQDCHKVKTKKER